MTPRGPADLVAAIPRALDREPASEVVMIGVSDDAPSAALVYCVDAELSPDDTVAMVRAAVAGAASDGAQRVAIVAYADDALDDGSTVAAIAAALHVLAEESHLRVLDTVAVADSRWRSYTCDTPSCCPPEGTPIPKETDLP